MSKANGTIEKKENYLQHVSLKNYKSIKDAEIDFKPGLNIIIGKNGSGKTNFVSALHSALNFHDNALLHSEYSISAVLKKARIEYHTAIKQYTYDEMSEYNGMGKAIPNEKELSVNDEKVQIPEKQSTKSFLFDNNYYLLDVLIKHGAIYTKTSPFVSQPFSFDLMVNGQMSMGLIADLRTNDNPVFFEAFFFRLIMHLNQSDKQEKFKQYLKGDREKSIGLKNEILSFCDTGLNRINNLIAGYSPINEIRVNQNFEIHIDRSEGRIGIGNFKLEYSVDGIWVPFEWLSDGTRRLFYIISEVMSRDSISSTNDDDLVIILLEEPELGIHPHQLYLLMQFIKEQSRYKQIIVTTHSPQVLDFIDSHELGRVIICSYDSKNGTQLKHFSEKQISKAKRYMEDAFLSDYWRFSDLEPVSQ